MHLLIWHCPHFTAQREEVDVTLAKWGCTLPPAIRAGIAPPLKVGFGVTYWGKELSDDTPQEVKTFFGVEDKFECKFCKFL